MTAAERMAEALATVVGDSTTLIRLLAETHPLTFNERLGDMLVQLGGINATARAALAAYRKEKTE